MMQDLIPPHGGVSEPVDRTVPAAEAAEFRERAQGLQRLPVSDADLSSLYRLGDGGLSPLTGPMDRETAERVLDDEVLLRNGKAYARFAGARAGWWALFFPAGLGSASARSKRRASCHSRMSSGVGGCAFPAMYCFSR